MVLNGMYAFKGCILTFLEVILCCLIYICMFCWRCILAGSCKDTGKTYALYSINVYRASSEGTKSWTVFRRYSDFDDLHMHLKEKVAINLFIVSLHCFYAV